MTRLHNKDAAQLKYDTRVDQLTHCHHATTDLPGVGTGIPGTGWNNPETRTSFSLNVGVGALVLHIIHNLLIYRSDIRGLKIAE